MSWSEEDEAAFNDGVTMRFAGGKPAGGGTVLAGLAKGADARPGTCAAVLEGEKAAKPGGPRPRAAEPGRKRGALIAAGLLSLAAVAGVGGWRWWQGRQEAERARQVEVARQRAEAERRAKEEAARIAEEQRQTEHKGPKPGEEMTITLPGGAPMTFCWCPAGSFLMGSPKSEEGRDYDETRHRVTLTQGFWMGKYEVTQAQWEGVMGSNPSRFKGADRPVERVSWDDCTNFIARVNAAGQVTASLPTEAQWEYACRAGSATSLPNGRTLRVLGKNNGPALDEIAWYGGNASVGFELPDGCDCSGWLEMQHPGSRAGTHPVGRKKPNDWGLYDMIGNVCEWCADRYDEGYYGQSPTEDPTGPSSGADRVSRGGSWGDGARLCRSANRVWSSPGFRGSFLGFRVALAPSSP